MLELLRLNDPVKLTFLEALLRDGAGADVALEVYEGLEHAANEEELQSVLDWMRQRLPDL